MASKQAQRRNSPESIMPIARPINIHNWNTHKTQTCELRHMALCVCVCDGILLATIALPLMSRNGERERL